MKTRADPKPSETTDPTCQSAGAQSTFVGLVLMEARKQLGVRASRWLIVGSALLVLGVYAVGLFTNSPGATFVQALAVGGTPLGVVLPIIAILGVAGEWSTGSVQFTYLVEPRRLRVLFAQAVAAFAICVAMWLLSVAAAAGVSIAANGPDSLVTAGSGWAVLGMLVLLVVNTLSGVTFGALLQSTPAAIVAFLALPTVGVVLLGLVLGEHWILSWLSINDATSPLVEQRPLTRAECARLATAALVWIALPLSAGALRLTRRDVA